MQNKKLSAGIFITALIVSGAIFFVSRENNGLTSSLQVVHAQGAAQHFSYTDTSLAPNTNYTYTLILTDINGEQFSYPEMKAYTSCSPPPPPPPPLPFCVFSAAPPAIVPPQSSSLSWNCSDASSCSIDNGIGSVGVNGSSTVKPSQTTTYTLSCNGAGGDASFQTTARTTRFDIREVAP